MAKKKKQTSKKNKKNSIDSSQLSSSGKKGFPSYFTDVKVLSAILFVISFLIYSGTLGHDFTQDDAIVITDNDYTKVGDFKSLLKYDTFKGFFKVEGKANLVSGGRYRPLTPIMFAIGWKISQEPALFHFMNLLWYGLTVVLLFIVLLKLLQSSGKEHYAYFVAFVAALLFAIHPVHTEVVANIKGRDEIMTLFLSLAALYFSLKAFEERNNIGKLAVVGLLFFLALMAKEMAVVFIPIVAISFYVFKKTNIAESLLKTIPYIIGFAVFMAIRMMVLGDAGNTSTISMEPMNNPFLKYDSQGIVQMSGEEKFGTIFYTLGKYLQLLIAPVTLTHDYYPYSIPTTKITEAGATTPLLIYLALTGVGIWGVLKRKHFAYGIAFFLISMFLVSNIPVVIGVNMAERFLFMPSVGFCFLVAVGLWKLAEKLNNGNKLVNADQLTMVFIILGVISLAGVYKTVTRSMDWKDNFTLFQADWQKSENSAKIRNAMGGELTTRSQDEGVKGTPKEKEMLDEALGHLEETTRIHPNYKGAYLIKGNANLYLQNYNAAIQNYQIALQLDPGFVDAENNLKIAMEAKDAAVKMEGVTKIENEGIAASQRQDYPEAIRIFTGLLNQYPNEPKYHYFIGVAKASSEDISGALKSFLQALELDNGSDPKNTNRMVNSVVDMYTRLGDTANANKYKALLK